MKVDDILFSKFVGNALTCKQMKDVEQQLIADRELSTAVEASILDYEIRQKDASVILGIEEFDSLQGEKSSDIDRIDDLINSEKVNNAIKTSNNYYRMNFNFTKEEVLKIQGLSAEFNNTEDKNLALNENLIAFYLNQRPGTAREDAEKVVKGLTKGVQTFHEELSEALKNNGIDYLKKLKEIGTDLSNEQKYEIYINFLSMLTVLDVQNFDKEKMSQIDDFQTVKSQYSVSGEVTDEMLEEVVEKVANALKENTFCLTTAEMFGTLFDKIQAEPSLIESLSGSEEDYRLKLINAMATYVAYQNGEISSLAGQEIAPEFIAVGAAAGVEQARTVEDFRTGRISWDTALTILKIIGGVAIWCYLTLFFVYASILFSSIAYVTLFVMLGGSIGAMILSGIFSICLVWGFADFAGKTTMTILDWSGSAFDHIVSFWQKDVWPSIKKRTSAFIEWMKGKKENKQLLATIECEPPVIITQS